MIFIFFLSILLVCLIIFKKYKNKKFFFEKNVNLNFIFIFFFLSLISFISFYNFNVEKKINVKNNYINLEEENLKKTQLELKNVLINLILNTYLRIEETEKESYRICQLNKGDLKTIEDLIIQLKLKHNLQYYTKEDLLSFSNSDLILIAAKIDRDFYSELSRKTLNFIKDLKIEVYQREDEQKY